MSVILDKRDILLCYVCDLSLLCHLVTGCDKVTPTISVMCSLVIGLPLNEVIISQLLQQCKSYDHCSANLCYLFVYARFNFGFSMLKYEMLNDYSKYYFNCC